MAYGGTEPSALRNSSIVMAFRKTKKSLVYRRVLNMGSVSHPETMAALLDGHPGIVLNNC